MRKSEQAFNILTGLSLFSWGLFGIIANFGTFGISQVRVCITLINIVVGFNFLVRKPLVIEGTKLSVILSLPSLFASGLAYNAVQSMGVWSKHTELLFTIGSFLTILSFLYLGRCFSVLPSVRGVIANGPYRIIRHPAYLGELLMISGCFFAKPGLVCVPFVVASVGIAIRILAEEKILLQDIRYKEYSENVNWRLFPGIW